MHCTNNTQQILQHEVYHIYNRSNGIEEIFNRPNHCNIFLRRLKVYLLPFSSVYAYVLMPNHFHLMLRVNSSPEAFSKAISDLCNSFARIYNLKNNRHGNLFSRPFKRKLVTDEAHQIWLAWYIHRNPLHHGVSVNWDVYPYSSYPIYMTGEDTWLESSYLLDLFGGKLAMQQHHKLQLEGKADDDMG